MKRYGRRPARPLKFNANRVGGPQTSRVTQTLVPIDVYVNTPYRFQVPGITGDRALAHAPQYALYRIAKVAIKYVPKYDTFTPGLTNSIPGQNYITTTPKLYWKMNRFADAPAAFAAQDLRAMGARPVRLDDKSVPLSYKPNILTAIESGGSDSGQVKITPWLNTDNSSETVNFAPSTTSHYGHFFYVEADTVNTSSDPLVATMEVTIFYEFKNPRVEWTPEAQGGRVVLDALQSINNTQNQPLRVDVSGGGV